MCRSCVPVSIPSLAPMTSNWQKPALIEVDSLQKDVAKAQEELLVSFMCHLIFRKLMANILVYCVNRNLNLMLFKRKVDNRTK